MVGKIHKKKISEYTEAAENEDRLSEKGDEGDDETMDNIEAIASASESENGDIANMENNKSADSILGLDEEAGADDDAAETDLNDDEDFKAEDLVDEDDGGDFEENDSKKGKKRKNSKKSGDGDSDDEAFNGSPKKKGRKSGGGGKAKAKATKTKAKKAAAVDDDDEEEGEEEYEVKDIVGHKMERGVSYFLIRWKGYTKADDTWEAEDTLNCPEIIDKYKKKQVTSSPKKKAATPAKKAAKKPAGKAKKEEPEQEWEVEKIIDYAEEKKGRVFRIRWKGFGPKQDTWEPEANLNCQDIIQKFLSKMKTQDNVSFKELREEPKKPKRLFNETAPRTNLTNAIGRKSKRSVTKKSDDEDDEAAPVVEQQQSAPIKKSLNEFERLCKSISETVSKINTSIDEPLEDNVDLQFLKMMLSLMKDIPSSVKNKFQADMFAEIYKIRVQYSNTRESDRHRGNTSTPAAVTVAKSAPKPPPKAVNNKVQNKKNPKRAKRWI